MFRRFDCNILRPKRNASITRHNWIHRNFVHVAHLQRQRRYLMDSTSRDITKISRKTLPVDADMRRTMRVAFAVKASSPRVIVSRDIRARLIRSTSGVRMTFLPVPNRPQVEGVWGMGGRHLSSKIKSGQSRGLILGYLGAVTVLMHNARISKLRRWR